MKDCEIQQLPSSSDSLCFLPVFFFPSACDGKKNNNPLSQNLLLYDNFQPCESDLLGYSH